MTESQVLDHSRFGRSIKIFLTILLSDKIINLLISLVLIKYLAISEYSILTQVIIYSNLLLMLVDFGTSTMIVNNMNKVSAIYFLIARLVLFVPLFVVLPFFFQGPVMLFLFLRTFEGLLRFPQLSQLGLASQRMLKISQWVKTTIMVVITVALVKLDRVILTQVLWGFYTADFVSICLLGMSVKKYYPKYFLKDDFEFNLKKIFKRIFGLYKSGLVISLSQIFFFVRLSLPLYILSRDFELYLKEFRLLLFPVTVFQDLIILIFVSYYPTLIRRENKSFELKYPLVLSAFVVVLAFVVYATGIESFLWTKLFSEIERSSYHLNMYVFISLSIVSNFVYLSLVNVSNSVSKYYHHMVATLVGCVVVFVMAAFGYFDKNINWFIPMILTFDLTSIFVILILQKKTAQQIRFTWQEAR